MGKKRRAWRRHWTQREPWVSILYLVAWVLPAAAAVVTLLQLVRKFWP